MKNAGLVLALALGATLAMAPPSMAQFQRYDYIWARTTAGAALTLDGKLDEPQWAQAESIVVNSMTIGAIPGSGWKGEGGLGVSDPNRGVFRFLVVNNQLWLGVTVKDSTIGGSELFNRFDGLLMSIKQHQSAARPAPPGEHLISWWYPPESGDTQPLAINKQPSMKGVWRPDWTGSMGTPTPEQLQAWDARWTINGIANSDTLADQGYVFEMRFDLGMNGYDVTGPGGDIVEWNCSLYDMDWFWPVTSLFRYGASRTWIQGPWGNAGWYSNLHILSRPDVTVGSGATPVFGPDLTIPSVYAGTTPPVIDGQLNDPAWASAGSLAIRYDDPLLLASYPNTGKYRSGQYQPPVNGGQALVQDPTNATVKYFVRGNLLYIGIDQNDAVVQYHTLEDRFDGAIVSINDRTRRGPDLGLLSYPLKFQVGPSGQLVAYDSLAALMAKGVIRAALALKPGTTVDTLGVDTDAGWTFEMEVYLPGIGYPLDLGDRALYFGVDILDGDSYPVITDSYGTRTFFFRERENLDGPCVAYLSPYPANSVGVDANAPASLELLGNFPNPFRGATTIHYRLPQAARVSLEVYDVAGRLVSEKLLGVQSAGERTASVSSAGRRPGLYLYRVRVADAASGAALRTLSGRMMIVE